MKQNKLKTVVLIPIILLCIVALNSEKALGSTVVDISYDPTPVVRNVGEEWSFDIILNGQIARPLFNINFSFRYDPDVISFGSASYGNWFDTWNYSTEEDPVITPAPYYYPGLEEIKLDVDGYYEFEDKSDPPRTLVDDIFATVTFNAIGEGTSLFDSAGWGYSSGVGFTDLSFNIVEDGEITVSGAPPVPEPTTILLFGVGLLGIAGVSRRRNK